MRLKGPDKGGLYHMSIGEHRGISRDSEAAWKALVRGFDIIASLSLILFILPLATVIVGLLVLADGGPVFETRPVIGKNGRVFQCVRFRSNPWRDMAGAQATIAALLSEFIERSSLGELAQLINVLHGDMSIIGPRPLSEQEVRYLDNSLRYPHVKPGLTGCL